MLISQEMNDSLNQQIGNEFSASLQYVAIAAYFDSESLPELAAHFYRQAEEERDHAMRFVKYVLNAGGRVEIPTIPTSKCTFSGAAEAVKYALDGEITVTHQINELLNQGVQERDYITQNFLQWFVTEQLEEVSTTDTLFKIVQRAGDNLLHVEDYLARSKPFQSAQEAGSEA
jgi:ferritin